MIRAPQSQGLVKLYRQFSRVKYNQYKHSSPRLLESEIIAKVQKEWDTMDEKEKMDLQQRYQQKNEIDGDDDNARGANKKGSTRAKSGPKGKKVAGKAKKEIEEKRSKDKVAPQMVVMEPEQSSKFEDSQLSSLKGKKKQSESLSQSERLSNQDGKGGKTKIAKNREYLAFYKYYYDRLSKQHPKWKSIQISTIIKLLWRKRMISKRNENKVRNKKIKAGKGILKSRILRKTTGYLTFKKKFINKNGPGTSAQLVKTTYKKLTFEHKHLLNREAKQRNNEFFPVKAKAREEPSAKVDILLDGEKTQAFRPLAFLNNPMRLTQ